MTAASFNVAIIGGGLCGLALAIALSKRDIPFHIYEARSSFTEIGAGINVGPNTLKAFEHIDPALGDAIYKICSRNPLPKETVWMQLRYGAQTDEHADYELITELMAPPTGNMAAHRNDLLQLLADHLPPDHASFDKKLSSIEQDESNVKMSFADGSTAHANIVLGCDGVHSAVRTALFADDPASSPQFAGDGAYRAMIPVKTMQSLLGEEDGRMSQILLGPNGYLIMYTIAGGENVNVGLWTVKQEWTSKEWVKQHQRDEMLEDFRDWGETAKKIMDLIPDPSFWATHSHIRQPNSPFVGRVCLIGDSAHSMPPHQGSGAGQAMEDAYVMAEVLSVINQTASLASVRSAFEAFNEVRVPHSQDVLETSVEAMRVWSGFHQNAQTEDEVGSFIEAAKKRFVPIWEYDLNRAAVLAKKRAMDAQAAQQATAIAL